MSIYVDILSGSLFKMWKSEKSMNRNCHANNSVFVHTSLIQNGRAFSRPFGQAGKLNGTSIVQAINWSRIGTILNQYKTKTDYTALV